MQRLPDPQLQMKNPTESFGGAFTAVGKSTYQEGRAVLEPPQHSSGGGGHSGILPKVNVGALKAAKSSSVKRKAEANAIPSCGADGQALN